MARPTIVSLNPCSDAILAQVADPAQILAISHYSADPRSTSMDVADAARFRATRGTLEEVIALQPDLVVASSFIDPATRTAYDRMGFRVETLGIASTVDQSRAQIRQLAALAGHAARGEALIARIDADLARAQVEGDEVDAVVWQSGGMVPGDGSLIIDLLRRTGFANFAGARGLGQADRVSLEQILADPPQVVLTARDDSITGEGSSHMLDHPALEHMDGTVRAGFAPQYLFCGGPTISRAAGRLAQIRRGIGPT